MAKKLTDADLVILAAAATRESGLVLPLPASLGENRPHLAKLLEALVRRGAITERPKLPDEDTWQTREDGEKVVLVISPTGLQLVGIEPLEHVQPKTSDKDTSKAKAPHRARVLRPFKPRTHPAKQPVKQALVGKPNNAATGQARPGTKLAAVIAALTKPKGATIAELMTATGWQAHSVRGAISGALKKKLKLEVSSELAGSRGRVYRIVAGKGEPAK